MPHRPTPSRDNRLLAALSSTAYDSLALSLSRTRLAAGTTIFDRSIDCVLFILRGVASPIITTTDGNPLGVAMIGNEGVVGLPGMNNVNWDFYQVRVQIAVEALQISMQALHIACRQNREVENLLHAYSDALFGEVMHTMACHYHHDLDRRLPRWLLMACERARSNTLFVTQEALAEAHGVTPGAVSLVLDKLEQKSTIRRARGQIIVLNRRKLRYEACECYSLINQAKKYFIKTLSL